MKQFEKLQQGIVESSTENDQRRGFFGRFFSFWKRRRITPWLFFFFLIYIVAVIKFVTIKEIDNNILFASYSLAVSFYIISIIAINDAPTKNTFFELYEPKKIAAGVGVTGDFENGIVNKFAPRVF